MYIIRPEFAQQFGGQAEQPQRANEMCGPMAHGLGVFLMALGILFICRSLEGGSRSPSSRLLSRDQTETED